MRKKGEIRSRWMRLSNGEMVQGKWEYAYGECLIAHNIPFVVHPKPIYYTRPRTGGKHAYYPDFYLPATDEYIEISPLFSLRARSGEKERKLRYVREQNPHIVLRIVTELEMRKKGII
jgi:hypothetical protein